MVRKENYYEANGFDFIWYKYDKQASQFKPMNSLEENAQPALVIQAYSTGGIKLVKPYTQASELSTFISSFKNENIEELLLAAAAAHS